MGVMQCHKHGPWLIGQPCEECVSEKEYYDARKAGLPLPFVGYERTLDWRSVAVVHTLEEFLRKRYSFRKSQYPHSGGKDSLVILPGKFTEPLTIAIYYVTQVDDQDYLLAVIHEFFAESEYPQRKVEFFEEERWYSETRGTTTSFGQLDAVLLREELVR